MVTLYYPLLRRVPVTHVAYFSVIPTTGTRYAPSGLRNRSDRRPSTSVYRKFIRSHRHATACRFEEDRQPPAIASSRRSQMKVTRYRVNNGSTCATNGAPAKNSQEKRGAVAKEMADKRFFLSESGENRKNVIALPRDSAIFGRDTSCTPAFASRTSHAVSKELAYDTYSLTVVVAISFPSCRRHFFTLQSVQSFATTTSIYISDNSSIVSEIDVRIG